MPLVTGNVLDVSGVAMPSNIPQLIFRLNRMNVTAAGSGAGSVYPTKERVAAPASDGTFSVNLTATSGMHLDAWYEVGLRWNESSGTLWDFGLRVRVPSGGPHNLADLIDRTAGGGGGSPMVWWFGLTPPPSGATIWNYMDPSDPDRETGPIPGLAIGDIITSW